MNIPKRDDRKSVAVRITYHEADGESSPAASKTATKNRQHKAKRKEEEEKKK